MRRMLFQAGILKRKKAELPTLIIGNIAVGGTGKTPFVLWLSRQLQLHNPAVLSRGYGRKTKGFIEVLSNSEVTEVGDEPMELRHLLPSSVRNFVCENRLQGVQNIQKGHANVDLVLLDDGFQHLPLLPDAVVLLCDFNRPFFKDFPMPAGGLREFRYVARYATCIVVTKCPPDLSMDAALQWQSRLSRYGKPVFFATYGNTKAVDEMGNSLDLQAKAICVSALANNEQFFLWAKNHYTVVEQFAYRDHYNFTEKEIHLWVQAIQNSGADGIICSHKDAVKLRGKLPELKIFTTTVQPEILFGGEHDLIELLLRKIDTHV